jgi:hypothetical protein
LAPGIADGPPAGKGAGSEQLAVDLGEKDVLVRQAAPVQRLEAFERLGVGGLGAPDRDAVVVLRRRARAASAASPALLLGLVDAVGDHLIGEKGGQSFLPATPLGRPALAVPVVTGYTL